MASLSIGLFHVSGAVKEGWLKDSGRERRKYRMSEPALAHVAQQETGVCLACLQGVMFAENLVVWQVWQVVLAQ